MAPVPSGMTRVQAIDMRYASRPKVLHQGDVLGPAVIVIAGDIGPVGQPALVRERVPDRLTLAVGPTAFDLEGGRGGTPDERWRKTHRSDLGT